MRTFTIFSLLILTMFSVLVFSSCREVSKDGIHEKLVGANKINIYFYDKGQGIVKDTKMMVVGSEQDDIKKVTESITDETSEQYKCGYSGQLEIFKDNELLLDSEFNFEDECRHYVFTYKNEVLFRVMTEDGSKILKNYYKKISTK